MDGQVLGAVIGGVATLAAAFVGVARWRAREFADPGAPRHRKVPKRDLHVPLWRRLAAGLAKSRNLSEGDVLAELESWMGNRDARLNTKLIRYSEVDAALRLPPGSAKKHLRRVAARWNYVVAKEGDESILFKRRPREPRPTRWMDGWR